MSEFRPIRFWRLRSDTVVSGPDLKVDLDVFARLPLRLVLRNVLVLAALALVVWGCVVTMSALDDRADRLFETGTRVDGTVIAVDQPTKGGWSVDVRYPVNGVERTEEVFLDADVDAGYHPGDRVTAIYDPTDPGRMRTDRERNESLPAQGLVVTLLVFLTIALPLTVAGTGTWLRRRSALRRAGWRRGVAQVRTHTPRAPAEIDVRLDTGDDLSYRVSAMGLRGVPKKFANASKLRVWVGGDCRAACVVFVRARVLVPLKPV